jgi:hypothetical protein
MAAQYKYQLCIRTYLENGVEGDKLLIEQPISGFEDDLNVLHKAAQKVSFDENFINSVVVHKVPIH